MMILIPLVKINLKLNKPDIEFHNKIFLHDYYYFILKIKKTYLNYT
jgi:hypothetical protein